MVRKSAGLSAVAAIVVAASGCGGDSGKTEIKSPATAAPSANAQRLDEDALLAVHDEFVVCAQKEDALGLIAHYGDGHAVTDSEGAGGGEYDDNLSAPKAIARLIGGEKAQYVGMRANRRDKGRTPNLDILIFPSESEASAEAASLGQEAGAPADQQGLFVTVPLDAKTRVPKATAGPLAACREQAVP
jgi:hypothetical protein